MAKDNLTPEEKLLKIIENPNVEKRSPSVIGRMKAAGAAPLKDWLGIFHIDRDILMGIA